MFLYFYVYIGGLQMLCDDDDDDDDKGHRVTGCKNILNVIEWLA